jgi:hypothetical protein
LLRRPYLNIRNHLQNANMFPLFEDRIVLSQKRYGRRSRQTIEELCR